jgi:spore germination cell wall hydrolase CwlJ-like protein
MSNRRSDFEHFNEDVLLAMLGWGEARGEPERGILAVMWVARNRSVRGSRALKDVILQPWQFSCFNDRDPNRDRLLTAEEKEPASWAKCLAISRLLLSGYTLDPTGGATHYYSTSIAPPYWAYVTRGWTELTVIGRHIFGIAR